MKWQVIKARACAFAFIFFIALMFGAIDFYTNLYYLDRGLRSKLRHVRATTFADLRLDFDKLLYVMSYEKVKLKLRFLNNAEVMQNDAKLETGRVIRAKEFLELVAGPEVLLFSLNEVFKAMEPGVGTKISFDVHTKPRSARDLAGSMVLLPGKLYLNYGIRPSVLIEGRNAFLAGASMKAGWLFVLLYVLNSGLVYFYKSKERLRLSEELDSLKKQYSEAASDYKRTKSENVLVNILLQERGEAKNNVINVAGLCEALKLYFNSYELKIALHHHVPEEIDIHIPAKDLYLICASLIFHKMMLSKDAEFNVRFSLKDGALIILLEDTGFTLSEDKMIVYTEDIARPQFILEWWQIVIKLKESGIHYTQGSRSGINFIKLEVPLEKSSKGNNICYLDDFRSPS
jgi:hypothetical protein